MKTSTVRTLVLTAALALANLAAASADPLPAATEPLKDFDGKGIIQVDLPGGAPIHTEKGEEGTDPGLRMWFPFRQAWVRPDRLLVDFEFYGTRQVTLIQGSIERTYSPATKYIVQRTYKNLETTTENPMTAQRLSMLTYGKMLRDLDSGKLLPAEDLDQIRDGAVKRIQELATERKGLTATKRPEDMLKAETLALEAARLRDELQQVEIRRNYPCYVMEYDNKDLVNVMLTRGLIGDAARDLLNGGKTRVWITRAEGLPIKMVTYTADGHPAIWFCFTELKINAGLQAGELVLGAPLKTTTLLAEADLKDPRWQEKMDEALSKQIDAIEDARKKKLQEEYASRIKAGKQ